MARCKDMACCACWRHSRSWWPHRALRTGFKAHESLEKGQGQAGNTSRLSLQSAVSVEIRANALAHSCPAKGYMPSGP